MGKRVSRRNFLSRSIGASTGAALAFGFEEKTLLARADEREKKDVPPPKDQAGDFPTGKIGDVRISRVICGGNLISGFAHSRDLIYVSSLLEHYFTDEKVFETFQMCEAHGINTAMLKLDPNTLRIVSKYWREQGGRIQWIAQITRPNDMTEDIQQAVDNGAVGVFTTGQMGDELVRNGQADLIAKAVERIKANGAIAGVSCHDLEVVRTCERTGVNTDFYMKTFNGKNYWSAGPQERHDSVFNEEPPEQTIEVMKSVARPWVAFKVLGAGAISPREGFGYAIKNGADFLCVGMFDFQVAEDAFVAKKVIAENQDRARPWRA
jgi:hypothetical protein